MAKNHFSHSNFGNTSSKNFDVAETLVKSMLSEHTKKYRPLLLSVFIRLFAKSAINNFNILLLKK